MYAESNVKFPYRYPSVPGAGGAYDSIGCNTPTCGCHEQGGSEPSSGRRAGPYDA